MSRAVALTLSMLLLIGCADAAGEQALRFGHAALFIDNGMAVMPFASYPFTLEVDGIRIAAFSEVTLPDDEVPPTTTEVGGQQLGSLTFTRGVAASLDLYDWYQNEEQFGYEAAQKNANILLLGPDGDVEVTWDVMFAAPTRYEASGLDAAGTTVLLDQVDLVFVSIQRER